MTMDEYAELMVQEEKERNENPCCANCRYYYTEYGTDCCKYYDYPKENVNCEKCSHWK